MFDLQFCSMDWDHLRYVLALARGGTLTAAARTLRVNQTTVTRRLSQAETAFGARLFERIDGAFTPTEAGETAIAEAERIEAAVDAAAQRISGTDATPAGTVRITSVPLIVNRLLAPALPELRRRHPGIEPELIGDPRNFSLTKREADIALRLARPVAAGALVRRIGSISYVIVGPSRGRADRLPWISYEEGLADIPPARWIAANVAEPPRVRVNDSETIIEAVASGVGRSLLPRFVVAGDRRLRQLAPEPALTRELWLMVHPELRRLGRIEATIAWMEAFARKLN
ncbi:MAG: LysR family transcriptional regulator [Rhodospirillaceae bacterium]|nr:LysR family transcriptional regulator [Rhodospirillaceae bacterium]